MSEHEPERAPERSSEPAFFDRGDRRTHLEQLRHLSQWSRRVLLVTGPRGVGKSTLYRQLSATLEPRAKAARINGSMVQGTVDVLTAMVQGFGLAAPSDAGARVLRDLVADHARDQERADRFCVSLIDDAEMLEPRALESLMDLVAGSPLRLVLFGEVRLVPAIERLAEVRGVGWHEIRLTGFSGDDVRAYLDWRLRQQGHTGPMPFTEVQIREIGRLSEGLPGRIDQMSNVLLARIQSAGHGPGGRRFPGLPQGHRGLLALLVAALGLAYLLWPSPQAPDVPPAPDMVIEPVAPQPMPSRDAEPVAARAEAEQAADPERTVPVEPPDGADDDAPRNGAVAPGTGSAAQPAAAELESEDGSVAEDAVAGQSGAAAPAAADAATGAGAAAEAGTAAVADTADRPQTDSPATAAPGAADGPEPSGARDATWILQQPDDRYTLQLVSFSTADRADEYLGEQPDPARFARFRLQRDGRILHVVIYGSFESRAAAAEASRALPESVGRVEPWIRTFGQVQDGVRTALQP